jgi:hypothetical protein
VSPRRSPAAPNQRRGNLQAVRRSQKILIQSSSRQLTEFVRRQNFSPAATQQLQASRCAGLARISYFMVSV